MDRSPVIRKESWNSGPAEEAGPLFIPVWQKEYKKFKNF